MIPQSVHLIVSPAPMLGALILEKRSHENGEYYILEADHPTEPGKVIVGVDDVQTMHAPSCCYAAPTATAAERLYAIHNLLSLFGPLQPAPATWAELVARAKDGDTGAAGVIAKWRALGERASGFSDREWSVR